MYIPICIRYIYDGMPHAYVRQTINSCICCRVEHMSNSTRAPDSASGGAPPPYTDNCHGSWNFF